MTPKSCPPLGGFAFACAAAALLTSGSAEAAENYRLRQPSFPLLGADMGATAIERVGFFGTAAISSINTYEITGDNSDPIQSPGQTIPLPTGSVTGGALPDGSYNAVVQPGRIDFDQTSQQFNLILGYLFDPGIEGARIGVSVNQIYQHSSREVVLGPQAISLQPAPSPALPPPLTAVLNGALANVATQVELRRAAELRMHNQDAKGFGDTTVALLYTQTGMQGRLRAAGAVSYTFANGDFQIDRGPNPGFNYDTTRIEGVLAYTFPDDRPMLAGVTLGARTAYGWNGRNEATDYRTGDFFNLELAAQKTRGDFAFGMNIFALVQTTHDEGVSLPLDAPRYEAYGAGPFIAYRFPGRNIGLNLSYADTFGVRNGQAGRGVSLRFIRTW